MTVTLPEMPDRIRWKPSGVAYRGYSAPQSRAKRPGPERFNLGLAALCLISGEEIRPSQMGMQINDSRRNPYILFRSILFGPGDFRDRYEPAVTDNNIESFSLNSWNMAS
jgi:hypothetical protein